MSRDLVDLAVAALLVTLLAAMVRRGALLRRDTRQQITRLEKLTDISRVLLTDRNIRGVLRHVAESAAELVGTDMAYVALTTPDPNRLVLEAATGPLTPLIGSAVPLEGSPAGWVVTHAQQLVLDNAAADGRDFRSVHERIPLRAAAALPIIAKGRCVGALGADNPRNGRRFGPQDVSALRELANYAALVIESLQAVEELAQRERRAALVNAVNSRIRQSLDLQQILDSAVRELGGALGASRCVIRLRRGPALGGVAAEWLSPEIAHPPGPDEDPALDLLQQAARERRTIESDSLRTAGSDGAPLSVLAAPIVLRAEAAGVIAFYQVGFPRLWHQGDIAVVEEVAADLAIAIANARLYRSVEDASRELSIKMSELERANRMKAQFLANMSHELRTPLNSVIGFSEMLQLGALDDTQRDSLETIARNGRHLLALVNDILDLSKVDAGRMELNLVATDIRDLVPDVLAGVESLVVAKDHTVAVDSNTEPLIVMADEMRVRQVLFNLLSNAVKFTPAGGHIAVHARQVVAPLPVPGDLPRGRAAVRVSIEDSGIGIEAADLPRLFTEFTQVDASLARRFEGTGLGLVLCKRFVELHGGRIGVESLKGQGSTFWIELPVDGPVARD